MYYPKQIPYLLDREFKKNIEYREYNIECLEDYIMCIWTMKSKKIFNKTICNNILPDACIDIVIDFINSEICFAGFSKETESFPLNQNIDYMGVRLKPGTFYSIFNIDATKIMDRQIPFFNIENEFKLDEIFLLDDTLKKIEYLKKYLLIKINDSSNRKFIDIIDYLYKDPKNQSVINIAKKLDCNQRQLFRIFKRNYGLSPKVLLNILRLHLCLTLLLEENANLIDIAIKCGFYDQSHFIKEIKRYTNISPLKLFELYR